MLSSVLPLKAKLELRPGTRSYARSWIRDGAFTCTALLQMGFTQEVREYVRWFAGFQFPDGRVPCCVDRRGADPTPENDSDGELIFTVAERENPPNGITDRTFYSARAAENVRGEGVYCVRPG